MRGDYGLELGNCIVIERIAKDKELNQTSFVYSHGSMLKNQL